MLWILVGARSKPQHVALCMAWIQLLLAFFFLFEALTHPTIDGFFREEKHPWIQLSFGQMNMVVHYWLGLDALSALLIALSAMVVCIALAHRQSRQQSKRYYVLILLLQVPLYGCLMSRDLLLFFMCFEITLLPTYLLIAGWGTPQSPQAALYFLLYNFVGSIALFWVVIVLYALPETTQGIALHPTLLAPITQSMSPVWRQIAFLSMAIGLSAKLALFPLHSWLPRAHVEALTPLSILLAGILLKLGGYALLRLAPTLFPIELQSNAPYLAAWGVASILYGAINAFAQNDTKRTIAYSSIAHMGWIWLGIASLNTTGFIGAAYQMTSHGLITAGLFLIVHELKHLTGTRHLNQIGGLHTHLPKLSFLTAAFFFAAIGVPAFATFIAEYLTLVAMYRTHSFFSPPYVILSLMGILALAATFLRVFRNLFQGPLRSLRPLPAVQEKNYTALLLLLLCVMVLGILPQPLLKALQSLGTLLPPMP